MKTIVYQSYRGNETPAWLEKCMQTVKDWAEAQGFDYQREDDFFQYVPDWYIAKSQGKINLIADLARLELARKYLNLGYERTVWLDADVVIFDSDRFNIDTVEDYLLCRETWLDTKDSIDLGKGALSCQQKVTNSILVFKQGNSFLNFYRDACISLMKNQTGRLSRLTVSTTFLSKLFEIMDLPLFPHLGLFSPILMHGLAEDKSEITQLYAKSLEFPIYAANLCLSFRNKTDKGIDVTDRLFAEVVDKLIATKGEAINQQFLIKTYQT